MRKNKNILLAALAALVIVPSSLMAQSNGSINTYSPYTMYGLGELNTQGTLSSRAMGGMGVAMRNLGEVNILNPASYSATLRKSMLFSYGMEGANYYNKQNVGGKSVKNSYATMNFHEIAMQMPLAKNMGLGLSLTPYSSVGYNISTQDPFTEVGMLSYTYEGGGDITQVKLGVGWQPIKNLSFGIAAQYYWGGITRSFTMTPYVVTGNGTYYNTVGETTYDVSKIKAQIGLQWTAIKNQKRNLAFGATYDLGGDLAPAYKHTVVGNGTLLSVVAKSIDERATIVLPNQVTLGSVYQTPEWLVGLDYTYQNWLANNSDKVEKTSTGMEVAYNNFSTVKLGAQWTPNRTDVRNYFKRVSYRGGLRYGGYQHTFGGEQVEQYAVTLGASFPIKMSGLSKIDFGFEYGSRGADNSVNVGSKQVGLIRQDYIKFSLGFSLFGEDYWFQRPKFD